MDGANSQLFARSQWHDCYNTGEVAIPPYGIAEAHGMTAITVEGRSRPAIQVRVPTQDNPLAPVFTGPTGVRAGEAGICHSEALGYAAHSGALDLTRRYGVYEDNSLLQLANGDFLGVGDTFTSSGNNVSLFYRRPAELATKILFSIASDNSPGDESITAVVLKATCGGTRILGSFDGCIVSVYDRLGCLITPEERADPELLIGRKGTASLLQNVTSSCEISGNCEWVIDALCCP